MTLARRALRLIPAYRRADDARISQAAQIETELTRTREALGAATESLKLLYQEQGALQWHTDPHRRRKLADYRTAQDDIECWAMSGSGPSMTEPARESASVPTQLKERLWELELALDDLGWQRQLALAQTEFSRYGLQQIMMICRLYFIKNPIIRRGVLVSSHYVFGRGVEITSPDEAANEVITDLIARNPVLNQIGLVEQDQALHTDGNLFFAFFEDQGSGQLSIRTIDATEIVDIMTDPHDASVPQYFHRKWMSRDFDMATGIARTTAQDKWYPALGYAPEASMIGGQVVEPTPVFQMKVGGLTKWLFGCPEVYCAIDWARAYKEFLEDWASLTRALATFAWNVKTQGGQQAVNSFQKILSTTLGQGGTAIERNPRPATASAFITGPGNELTPIKTSGSTTEPEQGRRVFLMVPAAFGLPETFFGDASVGALATAQSLDRPTELKFLERQERWREVLQRIFRHAIDRSAIAAGGKIRESARVPASQITINVKFPSILEHDLKDMVTAITTAATLNGYAPAGTIDIKTLGGLLLAELGVEDVTSVMDAMYPADSYDPEQVTEEPPVAQPMPNQDKQPRAAESARMLQAVEALTRASEKLLASRNGS